MADQIRDLVIEAVKVQVQHAYDEYSRAWWEFRNIPTTNMSKPIPNDPTGETYRGYLARKLMTRQKWERVLNVIQHTTFPEL